MVMLAEPLGAEIVRLSDVSQELKVGVGTAVASVRTLTNVSLAINERELIVLSGSRGAGERALLAVIAGDRRGVTGNCIIAPRARIRLMRIAPAAALALTEEWQRAESFTRLNTNSAYSAHPDTDVKTDATESNSARELFLLDVVSESKSAHASSGPSGLAREWNESNRGALFSWACTCRERGGAVVMAAGATLGAALFSDAFKQLRPDWSAVRTVNARSVRERRITQTSVRVIAMHSGRLAPSVQLSLHSPELFQP